MVIHIHTRVPRSEEESGLPASEKKAVIKLCDLADIYFMAYKSVLVDEAHFLRALVSLDEEIEAATASVRDLRRVDGEKDGFLRMIASFFLEKISPHPSR